MAYKIKWSPRTAYNFEDICNYLLNLTYTTRSDRNKILIAEKNKC